MFIITELPNNTELPCCTVILAVLRTRNDMLIDGFNHQSFNWGHFLCLRAVDGEVKGKWCQVDSVKLEDGCESFLSVQVYPPEVVLLNFVL